MSIKGIQTDRLVVCHMENAENMWCSQLFGLNNQVLSLNGFWPRVRGEPALIHTRSTNKTEMTSETAASARCTFIKAAGLGRTRAGGRGSRRQRNIYRNGNKASSSIQTSVKPKHWSTWANSTFLKIKTIGVGWTERLKSEVSIALCWRDHLSYSKKEANEKRSFDYCFVFFCFFLWSGNVWCCEFGSSLEHFGFTSRTQVGSERRVRGWSLECKWPDAMAAR